jgi:hypothetical protein
MDNADDAISDGIEVVPVVVVSQTFPARPSSIPDIRDFVRRCLSHSPLSEEDNREVGETVSQALLEAAGPTGAISVSFRIFPDHVEVDVLKSSPTLGTAPGLDALSSMLGRPASVLLGNAADPAATGSYPTMGNGSPRPVAQPMSGQPISGQPISGQPASARAGATEERPGAAGDSDESSASFADWMAEVLRREGMTMEAAARQLGVSVKTVSRWVGGATEPRLRDLRRIRELFGEMPFP